MKWLYKGKEINEISALPNNAFVFVYQTTHLPTGKKYIFEAKKHKHGYRTGDRQKGLADFLVIQADRSTSKVYMEWAMFKELCLEIYELHKEVEELKEKTNDTE